MKNFYAKLNVYNKELKFSGQKNRRFVLKLKCFGLQLHILKQMSIIIQKKTSSDWLTS